MEKSDVWHILEEESKKYPSNFGKPITDDSIINNAQEELNVSFSNPYTIFLKKFGCGILPGHVIYGISPKDTIGVYTQNVIEETKFYKEKQKWPGISAWYIVSDDGQGNPIGIDPEGKVWLSDHDSGFELIKLADSFEEFLYKLYTDTLYE